MSKVSPAAAGPAAAASLAAHEAATRPISAVNQAGRSSRPLRHALAWAAKLTVFAAYVAGVYLAVAVGLAALTPWSAGWQSALRLAAVAITAAGFAALRRNVGGAVDRLFLPSPSRYEVLTGLAGRLRSAGPARRGASQPGAAAWRGNRGAPSRGLAEVGPRVRAGRRMAHVIRPARPPGAHRSDGARPARRP